MTMNNTPNHQHLISGKSKGNQTRKGHPKRKEMGTYVKKAMGKENFKELSVKYHKKSSEISTEKGPLI